VKTEKTSCVLVICEVGRLTLALYLIVMKSDCKEGVNKSIDQSKPRL
jgi:hypothetical protein